MSWNDVRQRWSAYQRSDPSWVSQRQSLLRLILKAESAGVTSEYAEQASFSNISTAIRELKRAARWQNWGDFAEILRKCGTMSNGELRLALHITERDDINVTQRGDGTYVLVLTGEQFERVRVRTQQRHNFRVQAPVQLPTPLTNN